MGPWIFLPFAAFRSKGEIVHQAVRKGQPDPLPHYFEKSEPLVQVQDTIIHYLLDN